MIDHRTIAFDIDGVLADTMGLFVDIAQREYRIRNLHYRDITSYSLEECLDMDSRVVEAILKKILAPSYTDLLQPLDGATEVLARLGNHVQTLLFVTARDSADTIHQWIRNLLPIPPEAIDVVATGTFDGKTDVLLDRNVLFFVEDRLESCYDLKSAGIEPILYKQPWNRRHHPFLEISSWSELAGLMNI